MALRRRPRSLFRMPEIPAVPPTLPELIAANPDGPVESLLPGLAWAVLVPGLRWHEGGYGPDPAEWVSRGAAGLILFGGEADAAHRKIDQIRASAGRPLLFGADLERGAGQQFEGATLLPPAGAFGTLDRVATTRAAAELTAREARAIGIDVVFAPVADVASEPDNPIVGPRAFSSEVAQVVRHTAAWVRGALEGGAWPCAKHFPGHGRTRGDSHAGGVTVDLDRATVEAEWAPFAAAIDASVPMIMTAHVSVPSLDSTGRPATRSRPILQGGLRESLGFDGLIVTDALLMAGAGNEAEAAVEAIRAGVDLLLYPQDPEGVADALVRAGEQDPAFRGALVEAGVRVRGALAELDGLRLESADPSTRPGWGDPADEARAATWALESVRWSGVRAGPPVMEPGTSVHLRDVDDDLGGPYPPPSRTPFRNRLADTVELVDLETADQLVLAVWADTRGWKGRAGLSPESAAAVRAALSEAADRPVHIVLFGGERPTQDLPAGVGCWRAWGGEARMQWAAADRITGRGGHGAGEGMAE